MAASFENRSIQLAAVLLMLSALPTAHAYCYIDSDGYERCTMATGVRAAIGIVIAVVVVLLLFVVMWMRRRQVQRRNLAYIAAPAPVPPPAYPQQGSPYIDGGAYMANGNAGYYQPEYPQYPPPTLGGYDPQNGFAPPYQPPKYSPPAGVSPAKVDV
ncbi:hypothetical protein BKA93DRAFT_795455 [Sparassis latifolia]|uniref:Transmembrane protein n=1 Tax=Sparassis crispa TaxID=139825 RepID=A0A401GTN6_9APHY|nr:hypothetical protein SCP_0800660 [Sparassis crispa]GBE85549.1 hypothetical protein SCP_0800660 [Sparassis crispa]